MADTAPTTVTEGSTDSRVIRVFLSSTFRDFMEERDLLVKQVFPELRRKARERGVDVVDVDLRWGITEEESRQGKVIPICLGEIDRCRPYFVGMLGERYGWIPPTDQYSPEVIERQPWLKDHLGGVSVTELEILHGVLNDPAMAGRAFFYFRDPAWSSSQSEPGFVCDTPEEEAKLSSLKQRICSSSFPVAKNLADPKALADQIGHDLWELIEQQYPDLDETDALDREGRQHASYRRSRLGVYLGGKPYIRKLEGWIDAGQQKILITGESGAGKSALIANWMEAHQKGHPDDLLYAHHLGCSNDANALEPMLARMVQTTSKLMADDLTEPIKVPQDYWDLVSTVTATLGRLSNWCKRQGRRWIWVLDGLDRLDPDDQNALPWFPLTIPDGVVIVTSALECPAKEILLERQFKTLTIAPLMGKEQDALIQQYLGRYTKQLIAELRQTILSHPLAGSPLFLRVLLEELRQCGRYETLDEQLAGYLSAETIDDLYERVLERLEADGNGEYVRKVMTAIWASRSGLSEDELLSITELKPLQWAPIDLALEEALGRSGNRLVFDHDYLRKAVEERYLPTKEEKRRAHSDLADWYEAKEGWDERDSEELPWQLQEAERLEDLRDLLLLPWALANLHWDCGSRETIHYWLAAKGEGEGELDELIADALEEEIKERREDAADLIWFVDRIAGLFAEAGLYRQPLLKLRALSLELEKASDDRSEESMLSSLKWLADAHLDLGQYDAALPLYQRCLEARERLLGNGHPDTLNIMNALGLCFKKQGNNQLASNTYKRCLKAKEQVLGPDHPSTLATVNNLAVFMQEVGDLEQAESLFKRCLTARERLQGSAHEDLLAPLNNLATLYQQKGEIAEAETLFKRCLDLRTGLLGLEHPDTIQSLNNLASYYSDKGEHANAEALYKRCIEASKRLLGVEHPDTLTMAINLARTYTELSCWQQAEQLYVECLEIQERLYGLEREPTLTTIHQLGVLYNDIKSYENAERYLVRCIEARELLHGADDPRCLDTILDLVTLFANKGDYRKAEKYCKQALKHRALQAHIEVSIFNRLGFIYFECGDFEQAEVYYKRCLKGQEEILGQQHTETNATRYALANLLSTQERYSESIPLRREEITHLEKQHGRCTPDILKAIYRLAEDLYWANEYEESENLYREVLAGRISVLGEHHHEVMATRFHLARCLSAQGSYKEAIEMRRIELDWCEANEAIDVKEALISMHELGCDLMNAGEAEDALIVFQNCLSQRQSILGASHDETLTTVGKLIDAFSLLNRQRDAITLSQVTEQTLACELGQDNHRMLSQLFNQGALHEDLGELDQAENLFRQCLVGREKIFGEKHPTTLITAFSLADVLTQQKRHNEAIPLRMRELAWSRKEYGNTHEDTLTSINDLAIDLQAIGDFEHAETLYRELLNGFQDALEAADFKIGYALGRLARILAKVGKQEEALGYFQRAFEHRLQHEGDQNLWTNRERLGLARILHKLDRKIEAITLLQELEMSIARIIEPDDDDCQLLSDAEVLLREIDETPLENA